MFGFKRVGVVVLVLVAVAGCRTAPIYNTQDSSLMATESIKLAEVGDAIRRAGAGLGWQMNELEPGHMLGTLALRAHVAVVDIYYDTKSFSIQYKDSTNLKYNGTEIHKNYNGWIQNLEQAIRTQASLI